MSHYELQQLSNPQTFDYQTVCDRTKSDLFFLSVRENDLVKKKNLSPYFVFYDFDNIYLR